MVSGKNPRKQSERRKGDDRRKQDVGPPTGWSDRRHTVERRLPEVEYDVISHGEWEVFYSAYRTVRSIKRGEVPEDLEETSDHEPVA